jgi:hypothetical protein
MSQSQEDTQLLKFFRQITAREDREFILKVVERTAARQVQIRPSLRLVVTRPPADKAVPH